PGFEITRTIFKIHASGGHTHGAIDALLKIRREHGIRSEDVEEVVVGTYPIAVEVGGGNYEPKTPSEAKFSLPYCLAVALADGRVGLAGFSPDRLGDPKILWLAKKVRVVEAPEFRDIRLGGAEVTVRLRDRSRHSYRVDVPRGYPENPLSKGELLDKFKGLASMVLSKRDAERIIRTVGRLDGVEKIGELTQMLSTR
ncbi:MAG: MmgE/PrpD family protein, partial [Candidatus Bathyarchaeia archaeon]